MKRVRLIHWNAAESAERAARLRAAGYEADHAPLGPVTLRQIRENPPVAILIDLSRLPSHGRDVAITLRQTKGTRQVPLVFVDGEPEKVARVRRLLPDAVYTTWSSVRSALRQAIARPFVDPVVPESNLAGYSGTPLPKKLGIKENSLVVLVDAPPNFERVLGRLPTGATVWRNSSGKRDLTIWFVRSRKELEKGVRRMAATVAQGGLWIAWPKQTSGVVTDLTQAYVRAAGLGAGLVDYKICAIDATWSGLKFSRRR